MDSGLSRLEPVLLWPILIAGVLFVLTRTFLSVELKIRWRGPNPVQTEINYDPLAGTKTGMTLLTTLSWETKIATFSTPAPRPKPKPKQTIASLTEAIPQASAPANLDELFNQSAKKYGVDKKLLSKIAACESGFRPTVVNPAGPYLGMFQYLESTWVATRLAMGADPNPDLVFDAAEAIKTSAWKIAHGGLAAWPVCGR